MKASFPFEVNVKTIGSFFNLEITTGRWTGISYMYGKVNFPDEDEPILNFVYEVTSELKPDNVPDFEKDIGDFLVATITKMVENKEQFLFTGGV